MGKKSLVLLSCLLILASSVQAMPEGNSQINDAVSRYEQRIGKLPKPMNFVQE